MAQTLFACFENEDGPFFNAQFRKADYNQDNFKEASQLGASVLQLVFLKLYLDRYHITLLINSDSSDLLGQKPDKL